MKPLSKLEKKIGLFYIEKLMEKRNCSEDKAIKMAVYLMDLALAYKSRGENAFKNAIFINGRATGASVKECNEFIKTLNLEPIQQHNAVH